MHIVRLHNSDQAAAVAKIDGFLEKMMTRPLPAGVKLKKAEKSWNGGRMTFTARFSKGILGATIDGTVDVTDREVIMDSQVPALLRAFVSEDQIAKVINEQFDDLFGR